MTSKFYNRIALFSRLLLRRSLLSILLVVSAAVGSVALLALSCLLFGIL